MPPGRLIYSKRMWLVQNCLEVHKKHEQKHHFAIKSVRTYACGIGTMLHRSAPSRRRLHTALCPPSTYGNLHTLLICKLLVQILHAHGRSDDHWEAKIALYLRSIWYELHKAITAAAAEMAQMAFFEYTRGTTTQNALYAAIIMHFSAIRGKIMWLFCKTRQSGFISRFFQDFQVSRVFACGGDKFNFNPYRFLLLFYSFVQSKKIACS